MGSKLVKREVMLFALETNYKEEVTPDPATHGILVEEPKWDFSDVLRAERRPNRPSFGTLRSVHAGELVTVTAKVEVKGSGVAGTPPEVSRLLRACGMTEAVLASSVLYTPTSAAASQESGTMHFYDDGSLYRFAGIRGDWTWSNAVGDVSYFNFTLIGHYLGWEDAATPAITYNATQPPAFKGITIDLGSYEPAIEKFELSLGNEISKPLDAKSDSAYGEIIIADRNPTGSFDPKHTLKAEQDWIADWRASTGKVLTLGYGAVAGNKVTLNVNDLYYEDLPKGERNGVRTLEIPFGCGGTPPLTLAYS